MLRTLAMGTTAVAAILAAVLAYAATRPDHFQVQRSIVINASAERIFPQINDLHAFNRWNPFDRKGDIKGSYSGPTSGRGAGYDFDGREVGTGRIEIVDVAAPSKVGMRLTMIKPVAADHRVSFLLEPQGDGTRVTWAMDGSVPFVGKLIHLVLNMDKMVGREFETGLADLKVLVERQASVRW